MSHPPRGPQDADRTGRPGTLPPVPGRPTPCRLLWSASSLFLAVLSLLTWQVLADGPLREADERLGDALRHSAPPARAAELLADLGNMAVALPVLLAAMAWSAWRTRRWWPTVRCALALALVPAVVSALKAWTDRPGPLGGSGYFPSGHAATAALAFGAAALLIGGAGCRAWLRHLVTAAAAVLTLANGLGLVWRGYHWPLDVLASWCLAAVLLLWADRMATRPFRGAGNCATSHRSAAVCDETARGSP